MLKNGVKSRGPFKGWDLCLQNSRCNGIRSMGYFTPALMDI